MNEGFGILWLCQRLLTYKFLLSDINICLKNINYIKKIEVEMTGRGRGRKRKSEDFIFEVDKVDLSSDEDDSVTNSQCKIAKFDGELIESSKTEVNVSPADENEVSNKSVGLNTEESNEMEKTQSCTDKNSPKSNNDVEDVDSKPNTNPESNKSEVIECNDSSLDLNQSCIIIEDPIPVLVVSDDDDIEEEGEIVEDLEAADEVAATPIPKPVSISTDHNKTFEELSIGDEKFKVVEEIGPSPYPMEKTNLMNISFRCEKTMNQYGHLLIKFLNSFPELQVSNNKLSITVNESETFADTSTPKKRNKKKKKAKKDLFVVDPTPSLNDDNSQSLQFKYTSKFEIKEAEAEQADKKTPSSRICFNCDGDHALRDCSIPRNFRRINQARQQFLDKHKTVRYHVDQNQKLADLKPGFISENLRNALGLRKNDLPEHIYRMRCLGYPPGWLEEAKVQPSSLNLFDIDGEKMKNKKGDKSCLDPSKIIDYPGFNVPPEKGIHDDFRKHNVKPYNKWMHKSSMIKHFEECYSYKNNEDETSDMDISLVEEDDKKTVEKSVKDKVTAAVNSPSLVDLEVQKKVLMDELNSSQEQAKSSSVESEGDTSQDKTEDEEKNTGVVAVKTTELGTPILKSDSPYCRLPNPDNFSVGVSPVIDFENLPNSTGKYEELSKVLSKVRMTMKNIL